MPVSVDRLANQADPFAVALTVVFFIDLSTCWWYNSLNWGPFKKYRDRMMKYHKYTRMLLISLIIIHIVLHVMFEVFGIVF